MKCEKIGIYPFNNDCNVFLQYSDLISSDYRICELASLTGWGLTDKKYNCILKIIKSNRHCRNLSKLWIHCLYLNLTFLNKLKILL